MCLAQGPQRSDADVSSCTWVNLPYLNCAVEMQIYFSNSYEMILQNTCTVENVFSCYNRWKCIDDLT